MGQTESFETHRRQLQGTAYRMLGSLPEAEDAVQETWLRLERTDTTNIENLGGWLTTVLTRICLNVLRRRTSRGETSLDAVHVPDPVVVTAGPEQEAVLADSVGLAMLVVLETLPPAERVAFVLHDTFGLSFDEIAAILDRTPAAARQLASRARRRVRQGEVPTDSGDPLEQRRLVDAFFAAARAGDIDGLVAVLDPEVVLRVDVGRSPQSAVVRGARAVAGRAAMFASDERVVVPATVNGSPGVLVRRGGQVVSVMAFTVAGGRIAAIHALADPVRLASLSLDDR